jgi:hypothetical protein
MKKQAATAKGAGNSSCNGFEELVAIQLNLKFWPGQAKLKPADLGLKEDEVPEIYYLGNKNAKTAATPFLGGDYCYKENSFAKLCEECAGDDNVLVND